MNHAIRTDLAMEAREGLGRRSIPGLKSETLTPQEGQTPKEFREDLNQLLALWRQRENEA